MKLPTLSRPAIATVATVGLVLAASWLLPRAGTAATDKPATATSTAKPVLTVTTARPQLA